MTGTADPNTSAAAEPRILLVDDNTNNLQVLRETLDGLGYKLLIAKNGKSALEIVRKAGPDLILSGHHDVGYGRLRVCRKLKATASTQHIPVIFLTAMPMPKTRPRGFHSAPWTTSQADQPGTGARTGAATTWS